MPSLPRGETLYTSETMYTAPSNFNPLDASGSFGRAGARWRGLLAIGQRRWPLARAVRYRHDGPAARALVPYDPVHPRCIPWLATRGSWEGTNYVLHVRNGVEWSDGAALTGADVAYTVNLAKTNLGAPWTELIQLGLKEAEASGNTVTVGFSAPPPYAAWQRYLWTAPVLPERIWSKYSPSEQVSGPNADPVTTGPISSTTTTRQRSSTGPTWLGGA